MDGRTFDALLWFMICLRYRASALARVFKGCPVFPCQESTGLLRCAVPAPYPAAPSLLTFRIVLGATP